MPNKYSVEKNDVHGTESEIFGIRFKVSLSHLLALIQPVQIQNFKAVSKFQETFMSSSNTVCVCVCVF